MPGFDTAATLVSDVARELGLVTSAISDPFASSDAHVLQLVALMKPTGRELVRLHPWTQLQRQGTFNTAASDADYDLATVAADFGRLVDDTTWNRTQKSAVPVSTPQQWQEAKAWTSTGIYKTMRLWGEAFHLDPTPSAIEAVYFEYVSRYWGAASFTKEAPTLAVDVVQFDPLLFGRALKLRFLLAKGFDSSAALVDFQAALALAKGQDGAAGSISLSTGIKRLWPHLPETGFGQ